LAKESHKSKETKEKYVMFPRIRFAGAPAVIMVLGIMTTDVMAASSIHNGKSAYSAVQQRVQHHRHLVRRPIVPDSDDGLYSTVGPSVSAYREPSYAYAPGKGIPQDCDLPTNLCPNEMRDVP
jgi:hypothetical protein